MADSVRTSTRPVGYRAVTRDGEPKTQRMAGYRASNRNLRPQRGKSKPATKQSHNRPQSSFGLMALWQINVGLALTVIFYAVFASQANQIEQFLAAPSFSGEPRASCVADPGNNWCAPDPALNSDIVRTATELRDEGYICTQTPFVAHRVVTESITTGEITVYGFDDAVKQSAGGDTWAHLFCATTIPVQAVAFTETAVRTAAHEVGKDERK